jgi:two-component system, NarL family, sensor histidine kinase NreB
MKEIGCAWTKGRKLKVALKRMFGPVVRFLLTNGVLTVSVTALIMAAMYWLLDLSHISLVQAVTAFLFILGVTTAFFLVIYNQGRRLREEQERMLAVFENTAEGMLVLDGELNILESNPAARKMLTLEESQEQEKLHFCRICKDESGEGRMCDYHSCFIPLESGHPHEVTLRAPGGMPTPVSLASTAYKDRDGRQRYVFRIGELDKERRDERERIAKMMTHSILQAQEKERKRISRELHDGIGQSLYGALIQLDVIVAGLEGEEEHPAYARIDALQQSLRNTIEDIRHLSAELRPSVLDDMGLMAALRNDIQAFGQKFGIQVNFTYEGDKTRLPPAYETALYRIAQEALTNAAKYAQTARIDVVLCHNGNEAEMTVKDYGTGFELNGMERRGVGLYSMEERTEGLGGEFLLESQPGSGTVVKVKLPLNEGGYTNEYSGATGR